MILFSWILGQSARVVATIDDYKNTIRSELGERERFSDYLVRKGVLSTTMLKQLQNEFLGESKTTHSHSEYEIGSRHHNKPTSKRK